MNATPQPATSPDPVLAHSPPKPPGRGARALDWWRRHCDPAHGDPATRARLRRARSRVELLGIPAAMELARRLGAAAAPSRTPDQQVFAALDLARVLAHVTAHDPRHPMRAAGWKVFPGSRKESDAGVDRPLLSGARFKRLLETSGDDETAVAFIRLIALLGGSVNVERLSADFLRWNHPESGARTREAWAFPYWAAGEAAPDTPPTDEAIDA